VADSEPAYPTFPVTQGTSRPISQEVRRQLVPSRKDSRVTIIVINVRRQDGAYVHTLQNPMNAVADSRHALCNLSNRPHILVTAVHSRIF
jgi:hypothetical protein